MKGTSLPNSMVFLFLLLMQQATAMITIMIRMTQADTPATTGNHGGGPAVFDGSIWIN